jgi:peptidoglycan/xylan/chitin deacetylase (PgdA/CDA1 family)
MYSAELDMGIKRHAFPIYMICIKNMTTAVLAMAVVFASVWTGGGDVTAASASTTTVENVVAITFDDGPRRSTTTRLLDGLLERGVRATFFVVGENVTGNEDIIQRMVQEGHLVGNHTFSHVQLDKVKEKTGIEEIRKTNELLQGITGKSVEYIRPPYGTITEGIEDEFDLECVLWSVDPCDWNTTSVGSVVNYVVRNVKDGDIILLHDIYDSSVAAALEIIDRPKDRGYVFVTVDELMP